jgi:hypothetical protein
VVVVQTLGLVVSISLTFITSSPSLTHGHEIFVGYSPYTLLKLTPQEGWTLMENHAGG